MTAYQRARALSSDEPLFGLGITSALRTLRTKRGDHRAYVAIQTAESTHCFYLPLEKGLRSREQEEELVGFTALKCLVSVLKLTDESLDVDCVSSHVADRAMRQVFCNEESVAGQPSTAILPGSFNPLHHGHRRMQEIAQKLLDETVKFELCVTNVDKPCLDYVEIKHRLAQFSSDEIVLTNQPRFVEKANVLFANKGGHFVVGADTIKRIGDPKYYGTETQLDHAVRYFEQLGVRFLVFGRYADGIFETLEELSLPARLRELCDGVSASVFREDVSSSALRDTAGS